MSLFTRGRWRILALVITIPILVAGCYQPPSPGKAEAAFRDAQALEKRGDLEGAAKAYASAYSYDKQGANAAEALLRAGDIEMRLKRYDQAVAQYKLVEQLPADRFVEVGGRRVPARDVAAQRLATAITLADKAHASKATYQLLDFLVRVTGRRPGFSYAFAIFVFTLAVKILLTPLTKSQFRYMRQMTRLQPMIRELQERYADRKDELNRRMMALYREQGVNPLGCGFNTFLQMGIMILLYGVIRDYTYQFQNGYFLWIHPALARRFPGIVGANLSQPDLPLLVLYAISMYVSQKLTTIPATDPQQQQQQQMMTIMMPLMFLFILRLFPSAFTLYWLIFNVLTTIQQYYLMQHAEREEASAGVDGGTAPAPPARRSPRRRRR